MFFPSSAASGETGFPVGFGMPFWKSPLPPSRIPLEGRFCRVEPLDPSVHFDSLWNANGRDTEGRMWTYLPYGPFKTEDAYRIWMERAAQSSDPMHFAIVDKKSARALGTAAWLRFDLPNGNLEVGAIAYSPLLQRDTAATEAMFLMMDQAFRLGFRRYEWKCNALNLPSRQAARRLGFSFEGLFRQAAVVRERNRDTVWYSLLDREWSAIRKGFLEWLDPSNFDEDGRQRIRLSEKIDPAGKREERLSGFEERIESLFAERESPGEG